MTPGQFLLKFYHQPVGRLRDSWRNGGPWAERETERQRMEMERAAATLPALPAFPAAPTVALHLMTGRRFWYQTAFCLHSFARAAGHNLEAHLYDDGSIDAETGRRLAQLGPGVIVRPHAELRDRLDHLLPGEKFPTLRERWQNYPNIRKLIDVHLGSQGWKLVIDSDILFFRRPDFLISWLATPLQPLHAVDFTESYGYSRPLLERLAGDRLPPLVNVGLCGLRSENIDWAELEAWTRELHAREKTSYYLEQALVAMLATRGRWAVAPAKDYITFPSRDEVFSPRGVMHHYVAHSKRWYFRHAWRQFAPSPE